MITVTIQHVPNFAKLSESLKNPEQLMHKIEKIRRAAFYIAIASGKDAAGYPVQALSAKYAVQKRRKVGNKPIRIYSGKMAASYTTTVSGRKLTETVKSKIATYHQFGTENMPIRKLLPEIWEELPAVEQEAIRSAATEYVDDLIQSIASSSF